jgi:hypothetical protein
MRMVLVAIAWTILTLIIYGLAGCGEVTATKEAGGFWCLGVCAQKTVAAEVKVEGRVKP